MKKCEICGKKAEEINIVQIEEHEAVQLCDGCYSPDLGEIINRIEE